MNILRNLSAAVLLCLSGITLAEQPQVSNAHIVQPPPGAKVAAAYFTLSNSTTDELVITGVSTNDPVKKAEIHKSSVVDDVARMEKQHSIIIPAGELLEFKHGSYHVMLMGLYEPLESGNDLTIVLETSAGTLSVAVPIITPDKASAMKRDDHSNMDMSVDRSEHDMDAKKTMDHK